MNAPSSEQQYVIDQLKGGNHVIVDACAGSGKTTTIMACAMACPKQLFAMITYNKQLRVEVETKVKELGLTNIHVYNYHSIAKKYYSNDGHTDTGIRDLLRQQSKPFYDIPLYSIIVIDEAQDMTLLYYQLTIKFMFDIPGKHQLQIMVLGDKMQGLYGFKGSDERFLTMATDCWNYHPRIVQEYPFVYCTLKTSYRITNQMAAFVNNVMLGENRLLACRDGPPVRFMRLDKWQSQNVIVAIINNLVQKCGAKYSDFFCLSGSVKSDYKMKEIENSLCERGVPCFIPSDETQEQLDPRVIDGKLVFSTFHSVKGRQRKYVFVFGFDKSYFTTMGRDLDENACPSTFYVACTRATEEMYVLEGKEDVYESRPMPFLCQNHHQMKQQPYIKFQGDPLSFAPVKQGGATKARKRIHKSPTELIKFIPEHVLDIITPIVQDMFVSMNETEITEEDTLDISPMILTRDGNYEDISDLNGVTIPIMFYDHIRGETENVLQDIVNKNMKHIGEGKHPFLWKHVRNMPTPCETIGDYLYTANILTASGEKLYSRLNQIQRDEYNWLSQCTVDKCFERMDRAVGAECKGNSDWQAERTIITSNSDLDHHYIDKEIRKTLGKNDEGEDILYGFNARVDLMTTDSIWELKCTSELSFEHKLQIIIYTWLYNMLSSSKTRAEHAKKNSYLFNIKTGEWLRLTGTHDQMNQVVMEIIRGRHNKKTGGSDETFSEETSEKMVEMVKEYKK